MNAPLPRARRMSGARSGAIAAERLARAVRPHRAGLHEINDQVADEGRDARLDAGGGLVHEPAAVPADVLDGKIPSAADYGVVLTSDGAAVDEVKTRECRAALARERRAGSGAGGKT